jgi:hypothetical protein
MQYREQAMPNAKLLLVRYSELEKAITVLQV